MAFCSYADFERQLSEAAEVQATVFRIIARLCAVAVEHRATEAAARLLGQHVCWVRRLARIYRKFGDEISPSVPFHLYETALNSDDPHAWLKRAVAEGWSARQLAGAIRRQKAAPDEFDGDGG